MENREENTCVVRFRKLRQAARRYVDLCVKLLRKIRIANRSPGVKVQRYETKRIFVVVKGSSLHYCDAHLPWQMRLYEDSNGLLLQYMTNGADRSKFTANVLDEIHRRMNGLPGLFLKGIMLREEIGEFAITR